MSLITEIMSLFTAYLLMFFFQVFFFCFNFLKNIASDDFSVNSSLTRRYMCVCLFVSFWWDIIRLKWQSILTSSRSDSFSSKKTSKAQCVYEQSVTPCVTRIRQCWMLIIYLFLLWSIILRANSSQNGAQIWKLRQAWKLLKQSRVHLPSTFYPIHFRKMTIVKDLFC